MVFFSRISNIFPVEDCFPSFFRKWFHAKRPHDLSECYGGINIICRFASMRFKIRKETAVQINIILEFRIDLRPARCLRFRVKTLLDNGKPFSSDFIKSASAVHRMAANISSAVCLLSYGSRNVVVSHWEMAKRKGLVNFQAFSHRKSSDFRQYGAFHQFFHRERTNTSVIGKFKFQAEQQKHRACPCLQHDPCGSDCEFFPTELSFF